MEDSSVVDPELIISHKFPETTYTYNERDAALYALGVGSCARDALDDKELKYIYHQDGQQFIQVLPTFAALFSLGFSKHIAEIPGLPYDPRLLLHGQQYIEIYKPLPSNGYIQNKASIVGLHDKGKATIIEIEVVSYGKESSEPLCMNRMAIYLRGAGGFSKSSHPYSYSKYPSNQVPASKIPRSQPFAIFEECTQPSQALLYRLSGDYNPLHSDPMVAEVAGGWGYLSNATKKKHEHFLSLCDSVTVRAVIRCICKGDPDVVKSISGRFLLHVYPGETLITEMWLDGLRVVYQVKVKERNRVVLSGFVDISRLSSSL